MHHWTSDLNVFECVNRKFFLCREIAFFPTKSDILAGVIYSQKDAARIVQGAFNETQLPLTIGRKIKSKCIGEPKKRSNSDACFGELAHDTGDDCLVFRELAVNARACAFGILLGLNDASVSPKLNAAPFGASDFCQVGKRVQISPLLIKCVSRI